MGINREQRSLKEHAEQLCSKENSKLHALFRISNYKCLKTTYLNEILLYHYLDDST